MNHVTWDESQQAPPEALEAPPEPPGMMRQGKSNMLRIIMEGEPVTGERHRPGEETVREAIMRTFAPAARRMIPDGNSARLLIMKADGQVRPDATLKVHHLSFDAGAPGFARLLGPLIPEQTAAEILAAVSEGFCPAHKIPLEDDGGALVPWCSQCEASWCCGTPPLSAQPSRRGFTVSRIFFGGEDGAYAGELRVGTES